MNWANVRLIFQRELRDQMRDRRTLFMIAVLPLLLYPLIGVAFMQISQFLKKHSTHVLLITADPLSESPSLIENGQLAPEFHENTQLLTVDVREVSSRQIAAADSVARMAMRDEGYDAVVVFPKGFARRLASMRASHEEDADQPPSSNGGTSESGDEESAEPEVFFDAAKDKSRIAFERISSVLLNWREKIIRETLVEHHVPIQSAMPFEIAAHDVAEPHGRRAAMWSKVLPFVVLVWAMTGAFYPAVDLCAGEKERGTLETLLSSPAERIEIVWGKLLTIMVFSVSTALLNLICMSFTATLILRQFQELAGANAAGIMGPPPLSSLCWLLLVLLPISALFSALSLALATMARSTKEGQYYLMPLFLISMPLMTLAILPSAELDLGSSLIPLTGVMLLLRELMESQYQNALLFVVPVTAVTAGCCWVAIRWAVDQFNNESVLFSESERLEPGMWLANLVRDRGPTPTAAEAVLCGIIILVIRFFGGMNVEVPTSWNGFVSVAVVTLVAFVATPALVMTVMLTTSSRQTLLLKGTSPSAMLAAGLLALAIHPLALGFSALVRMIYPINPDALPALGAWMQEAPSLVSILLVIAVLPAICEELAFRGFILSGLRHMGSKWRAIVFTSIFFGIAHGIVQQSVLATGLGIVLGYLAVQTGSLLPCVLFHVTHNSLMVLSTQWIPGIMVRNPDLGWLFVQIKDENLPDIPNFVYGWPIVLVSLVATVYLFKWFRSLPFQPSAEERLHDALDREVVRAAAP